MFITLPILAFTPFRFQNAGYLPTGCCGDSTFLVFYLHKSGRTLRTKYSHLYQVMSPAVSSRQTLVRVPYLRQPYLSAGLYACQILFLQSTLTERRFCALRALPCKPTLCFYMGLVKHFFCKVSWTLRITRIVLCLSFLTVLCAKPFKPISRCLLCEHMHNCAQYPTRETLTRAFCSRHGKTFSQLYVDCKSFLWIFQTFLKTLGISEKSLTLSCRLCERGYHVAQRQQDSWLPARQACAAYRYRRICPSRNHRLWPARA